MKTRRLASRKCQRCGQKYHPTGTQQKYCSTGCYQAQKRERMRKQYGNTVLNRPRKCRRCGKRFKARNVDQKYCCRTCYLNHKTRTQSQRRRARKNTNGTAPYVQRDIFNRDGGKCQRCGSKLEWNGGWHLDHILPISLGGPDAPFNVQILCAQCNVTKGATFDPLVDKFKWAYDPQSEVDELAFPSA